MILREIKNMYIKNRLTEGVDFVRKEWLRSTGAYLAMNVTAPKDQYTISAKTKELIPVGLDTQILGQSIFYWADGNFTMAVMNKQISFDNGRNLGNSKNEFEFTLNGSTLIANGTTYTIPSKPLKLHKVFYQGGSYGFKSGCISYLKVDGLIDLIPCQLLKSIPATLDANKRARSAGECGMYDSISGKFYGNVASTGTFTVEGDVEPETHTGLQQIYKNKLIEGVDYETYDWLKGDGTAYIDTKVTNLSTSDYIKTIFDDSRNIGVHIRTWGRETTSGTNSRLIVGNDGYSTYIEVWGTNSSFRHNNGGIYVYDMYFDLLNNKVTINNQTYNLALPHGNGSSFPLFAKHTTNAGAFINVNLAKFKSFEIHNKINLVPCQLLRSIPRNLDAQCKERVAGECGMIDLVSGKFYGNVASSGTFTVENDNNE